MTPFRDIGCAHCTKAGADRACQICTRLICEECAADWTTCGEPSGRLVRLGLGARVRDIDPTGRCALVADWRRRLHVFDLRELRFLGRLPRDVYRYRRRFMPRLLSTGSVVYVEFESFADTVLYRGLRCYALRTDATENIDTITVDVPDHGSAISASDDVCSYVSDRQRVHVVRRGSFACSYEPLPRKVISAASVDGGRSLLASATWNEVALDRMVGAKLERLAHTTTSRPGNVTWLGIGGDILAAALADGSVEIWRMAGDHFFLVPLSTLEPRADLRAACVSRDGGYLALAYGDKLDVIDLVAGANVTFEDHTDTITAVRFGTDHVLISADADNRVVMRPRTPGGYARPLIPVSAAAG